MRSFAHPARAVLATILAAAAVTASAGVGDPPEPADTRDPHAAAFALAEEAREAGRLVEAEELYRSILLEDPDHDPAYYALWDVCRARPPASTSIASFAVRRRVPERFVPFETRHFVVFSDGDPEWTRLQADRLERAHDRFVRWTTSTGIRALPVRHKLVAIAFGHRDDFIEFARSDGNEIADRIAGYYAPHEDRLVFYHVESESNLAAARERLEDMRAEIEVIVAASRRARMTGRRVESRTIVDDLDHRIRRHDDQKERLDAFARRHGIAVTIHEAVHQLLFHTGVQSRYVQQPWWLTEGLATAFETDDPGSAFGPLQEYEPRRAAFERLAAEGRLLPLRMLMGVETVHRADPMIAEIVYHQGAALVSYLSRADRTGLRDLLRAINAEEGVLPAARQLALAEGVLGDLGRLQEAWLRAEGLTRSAIQKEAGGD